STVSGAGPSAALPSSGYPMRQNEPPRFYTLVSVGRDDGQAGHQSHVGNTDGLNFRLKSLLAEVGRFFGMPVTVTSGCRSPDDNRRAGGALRSLHLFCLAADIKVAGVSRSALVDYVRGLRGIGGIGIYCDNTIVHVDLGPRRIWSHPCKRKT
ncbi:MAG: D-Ala-D-Ala carboxypeptidase family metallohydrolase, partial [Pseudomonadota bacterium]|nr:D-Ala-D-Ala carboxypeptidase family metallohydrolase [Pseudomonadota bacterium]